MEVKIKELIEKYQKKLKDIEESRFGIDTMEYALLDGEEIAIDDIITDLKNLLK